jgi:hypothetical protein
MIPEIPRPSFAATWPPAAGPQAPPPFRGRALRRRQVMFREAKELLPYLPKAEGEATHAIMSGRYDLMVLLAAILEFFVSGCQSLRIATLSFNDRNTLEMAGLLRSCKVGTLTLLCSSFFKAHNQAEYAAARREAAGFPGRWRLAAARNHCKIVLADFGKRRLVLEGSANLRTNGNLEQLLIVQDAELFAWHAAWIDELVSKHEADDAQAETEAEASH